MLERFREFWTNLWAPVAHLLIRLGVTPNQVTFVSTAGVVFGALFFFPRGQLLVGVLFITAFVFGDLIDGYMARTTGKTSKWGAFFDSTMDRFGDAALFLGFAFYFLRDDAETTFLAPSWYVPVSLACLVFGSVTSYVRCKAEGLGYTAQVGIAERADRLVIPLVATGFGAAFGWPWAKELALWFIAIGGAITVVMRMATVYRQAKGQPLL